MPSNDDDSDFSEPFWYEGFYYCFGITHNFDDGLFTQQLDMISLPQSDEKETDTQKEKDKTKQEEQTKEAENTGTGGTTPTTPALNPTSTPPDQQEKEPTETTTTPAETGDIREVEVSQFMTSFFSGQQLPNC